MTNQLGYMTKFIGHNIKDLFFRCNSFDYERSYNFMSL
jgi:hypothetical protein